MLTRIIAPFIEAWGQVRVHRVRVVLSLLGVFLAVLAMTVANAVGRMGQQIIAESFDSIGGRPATIQATAYNMSSETLPNEKLFKAFDDFVERHDVDYSSAVSQSQIGFKTGGPPQAAELYTVEPDYGIIHRIKPTQGRWFVDQDAERLAPAVVVNEEMAALIGASDGKPTKAVTLLGDKPQVATVIGVIETNETSPVIYAIDDLSTTDAADGTPPSLELWVPPGDSGDVLNLLQAELQALGTNIQVDTYRMDGGDTSAAVYDTLTIAIAWIGLFLLALGALGYVNVAIVTVRQRIREIGIRRSFGASSTRVFITVLLETTLATAAAGVLAVTTAVAIVSRLPISSWVGSRLAFDTMPPFPFEAAMHGVLAATGVGLLVGLIPALIAVRANPVEAIRF